MTEKSEGEFLVEKLKEIGSFCEEDPNLFINMASQLLAGAIMAATRGKKDYLWTLSEVYQNLSSEETIKHVSEKTDAPTDG